MNNILILLIVVTAIVLMLLFIPDLFIYAKRAERLEKKVNDIPEKTKNLMKLLKLYDKSIRKDPQQYKESSAKKMLRILTQYEAFLHIPIEQRLSQINQYIISGFISPELVTTFIAENLTTKTPTRIRNLREVVNTDPINTELNEIRRDDRPAYARVFRPPKLIQQNELDTNIHDNRILANDTQNSHDSGFNMSSRLALKNIEKSLGHFKQQPHKTLHDIRQRIGPNKNLITVLDRIERNDIPIMTYDNRLESDIVNLVWSRIHHPENRNRVGDLEEIFFNQLNECSLGGDSVVCTIGRCNRIIGTLDGSDSNENICNLVPMHALKNALQSRAVKIIDETEQNFGHEEILSKFDYTAEEKQIVDNFNKEVISNIRKLYDEYSDVMPNATINSVLNPIIQEFEEN